MGNTIKGMRIFKMDKEGLKVIPAIQKKWNLSVL